MPLNTLFFYFIFSSNHDAQDFLLLGHDIDTWLIYVLVFFGATSLAFVSVWLLGFLSEKQSEKSMKATQSDFYLGFGKL